MLRSEDGSCAKIKYKDEPTTIMMKSNTGVKLWEENDAKRVWMFKGTIECKVSAQPVGRPMLLKTPHAEAEVQGTRFTLSVSSFLGVEDQGEGNRTRLEVREGNVKLTRLHDRASVVVKAGEYAIAARGVPLVAVAKESVKKANVKSAEKITQWVDLIEGDTLNETAWMHDTADKKNYDVGFILKDGSIYKSRTEKRVRLQRRVDFKEGEIVFDYEMEGAYWNFLIIEEPYNENRYEIGFDARLRGKHECRIVVMGKEVWIYVDGRKRKEGQGVIIEHRLKAPITGTSVFRFDIPGQTSLKISNMHVFRKE